MRFSKNNSLEIYIQGLSKQGELLSYKKINRYQDRSIQERRELAHSRIVHKGMFKFRGKITQKEHWRGREQPGELWSHRSKEVEIANNVSYSEDHRRSCIVLTCSCSHLQIIAFPPLILSVRKNFLLVQRRTYISDTNCGSNWSH